MPEILPDHVPSPRTPLVWDGTRYRAVRGHTDGTVQVRGENQLFSFESPLLRRIITAISGADGYIDSVTPGDGRVWEITNVVAQDRTSPTTRHAYIQVRGAIEAMFYDQVQAFGTFGLSHWHGHVWLEHDDVIRVYFDGALAGDSCLVDVTGYQFHKEI